MDRNYRLQQNGRNTKDQQNLKKKTMSMDEATVKLTEYQKTTIAMDEIFEGTSI